MTNVRLTEKYRQVRKYDLDQKGSREGVKSISRIERTASPRQVAHSENGDMEDGLTRSHSTAEHVYSPQ